MTEETLAILAKEPLAVCPVNSIKRRLSHCKWPVRRKHAKSTPKPPWKRGANWDSTSVPA